MNADDDDVVTLTPIIIQPIAADEINPVVAVKVEESESDQTVLRVAGLSASEHVTVEQGYPSDTRGRHHFQLSGLPIEGSNNCRADIFTQPNQAKTDCSDIVLPPADGFGEKVKFGCASFNDDLSKGDLQKVVGMEALVFTEKISREETNTFAACTSQSRTLSYEEIPETISIGKQPVKMLQFQCLACSARFAQKRSLKIHMRRHTGEDPYECGVCQERFTRQVDFDVHMILHTHEEPHECSVCGAKFKLKEQLKIHMRLHGEKPYVCSVCNKRFIHQWGLKYHMMLHTGEKPFACSVCSAKFRLKIGLKKHMRTHTGEKPFECSTCNAKFGCKEDLKRHLRVHTGEKPFECAVCNKSFKHRQDLKYHMKNHTDDKPHRCSVCFAKFRLKEHFEEHIYKAGHS